MADEAARRRELRRRRILENAEERKKKIFGTTSNGGVDASEGKDKHNDAVVQDSVTSIFSSSSEKSDEGSNNDISCVQDIRTATDTNDSELQNSVRENTYESDHRPQHFRTENGIDSVPEIAEHLRNINHLITNTGGNARFTTTQSRKLNSCVVQSATLVGALSTPIVPVTLALFVCILLSVKLEYIVSNSIGLPFLLWEAHHVWCMRHAVETSSQGVGGLLGLALVLCGVQQSAVRKMTQVLTVFKCVYVDFAFYILTIVIWYWIIGFPSSVHSVKDFTDAGTVLMSTATGDDPYANMEEF